MKNVVLLLIVLLLAGILYERLNSRREETHRRQGELELVRVRRVCAGATGDIKSDADCHKQISEWAATYPDLDKELGLAGRSLGERNGVMPDGHTRCIIGVDAGCQ